MGRVRQRADRAVLITDAQRSQEDQLRTRETRYILLMSVRVLAVILAAILVSVQPPLLWLWLSLCAVGMVIIPWVAVVLANDRLPKDQHRWRRYRHRDATPPAVGPAPAHRTIDVDQGGPRRESQGHDSGR